MAKIKLINDDSKNHNIVADMIFTDPPYEMSGKELSNILIKYFDVSHLVLITSMSQAISFINESNWIFNFDFVLDCVTPKKSKNLRQPNYLHQNGFYFTKYGIKSCFDRKRRQRSDVFEANGYWPSIIRAPRKNMQEFGISKNTDAITDILGSFDISSVIDLFSGSGSTGLAAFELGIDCTLIEKDKETFEIMKRNLKFTGAI